MVISFPFDIFTWKHLIGGISNPESLDRYVLMICDLRSPSSVYCCNRREVVPLWPLWLCRRDTSCPHQASAAAHRSVKLSLLFTLYFPQQGSPSTLGSNTSQIARYSTNNTSAHCLLCFFLVFMKLVCPGSASNLLAGCLNNCFGGSGGYFWWVWGFLGFFSEGSRIEDWVSSFDEY